jgi:NAD(P)-dependent dehydrogenase (short-subunit alcohol dehydrogenase family)
VDLGPAGVRVVGIRSTAVVDTGTIRQSAELRAQRTSVSPEQVLTGLEQATLLKRLPVAADTARLAAFLASEGARTLTGTIVNASSGSVID